MRKNKHFAEYRKIYFPVFAEYRKICFAVFAEYRKIFQPNSTTKRSQTPQYFSKVLRRKRVTCYGDIDQSTSTKILIL